MQNDFVSCGVFVVLFAQYLLRGHAVPISVDKKEIWKYRAELCEVLRDKHRTILGQEEEDKRARRILKDLKRRPPLGDELSVTALPLEAIALSLNHPAQSRASFLDQEGTPRSTPQQIQSDPAIASPPNKPLTIHQTSELPINSSLLYL